MGDLEKLLYRVFQKVEAELRIRVPLTKTRKKSHYDMDIRPFSKKSQLNADMFSEASLSFFLVSHEIPTRDNLTLLSCSTIFYWKITFLCEKLKN